MGRIVLVIVGLSLLVPGNEQGNSNGNCGQGQGNSNGNPGQGQGSSNGRGNPANTSCQSIVLFGGEFTGNIMAPNYSCSNNTENLTIANSTICLFSFDFMVNSSQNGTDPYVFFNYSKTGVWLLNTSSSYQLNITRDVVRRPTQCICVVQNKCSLNWTQVNRNPCNKSSYLPNCSVSCLDPKSVCDKAEYTTDNGNGNESTSNDDIIKFQNQSPTCQKYGSPVKKPELEISTDKLNTSSVKGLSSNTTDKAQAINALINDVLELMVNKTSAFIALGVNQGVLMKPQSASTTQDVSVIYSPNTNLSILEDTTQSATFPLAINIPQEALKKASEQNTSKHFTAVFRLLEFPKDLNASAVLNDAVYSIDMGTKINNLSNPINITFRNAVQTGFNLECNSWNGNGTYPTWTNEGCNTSNLGSNVICQCVHLTFFAVLLAPDPSAPISNSDLNNLTYITSIGCGLSIFFLGVALFMHFLLRRMRKSDSVRILINLMLALLLLNLTFLTNEYVADTGNVNGCKVMAGFMHYTLLCSFTWFGLEALHLCLQLRTKPEPIPHYFTKICIAGWAPPAVIVTMLFIFQKYSLLVIHPDKGKDVKMCWITDTTVHYVVNIGYYSVVFAFTFTTFIVMLRWIFLLRKAAVLHLKPPPVPGKRSKTRTLDVISVMGLCCTLGITWGFAFFAYGALKLPSYYIFTILNSFQGFFLFIYYYNNSRFIGENVTLSENSTTTKMDTMENPYENSKSS
ncbi:adhesion G-protein coupled receptor G5 isoform X2 [Hoplias malabaricus]|uniref:adhesion G-protein coupled receptor G5 isoform X2 n=1 Tax=Hoplias malabaricus TaxID=27720 RepID=UPI00346327F9